MTAASFARRCAGRPLAPNWWQECCPHCREDSLTIHRGFDSRILVACKAKCKREDIIKDAGVSEEDSFEDLPGVIEPMEEVVLRPLPVEAVFATSPSKDGKHGQQTNQACG